MLNSLKTLEEARDEELKKTLFHSKRYHDLSDEIEERKMEYEEANKEHLTYGNRDWYYG